MNRPLVSIVVLAIFLLFALTFLVPIGPTMTKVMESGNLDNFFVYATSGDWENMAGPSRPLKLRGHSIGVRLTQNQKGGP